MPAILRRPEEGGCEWPLATILATVLAVLAIALALPQIASAQEPTAEELRRQAEQMLGRDLSNQEILDMLRQSGLSPQQIRDQLQQRGFDPSAADPWLRVLEGEASQVPQGMSAAPLMSVLAGTRAGQQAGLDTTRMGRIPTDSLLELREPEFGPPVFGRQVFQRPSSQFQPVTTGPVPADYRLGPGDQLVLVLTGAVEQAYQLEVTDEGWIVIPEVGQVFVNGRTVEELREVLFDRMTQSYASLKGDPPATHFDMTVGKLRTNQVYVIGEVEEPSSYVLSSLATAMTALYQAGGPTRNGSFREIRVNRSGETVATVDLYDYLVRGDASQDVRLQQGDIVHVPVADRQVQVEGPVTRPAIYELTGDEALRDVLRYAGGVEPNADLERVQIRRILAPSERTPGRERAILDVPVGNLDADTAEAGGGIALRDGDEVQVFAVVEDARNRVTVSGAVWRPGTYGATDSTRIWDVIEAAGGLLPDAVQARAQIQRLNEETNTRRMIPVSLARSADGEPAENPRLLGMDQVLVYARRNLREERTVTVGGWVHEPGVYPFADGMSVADLILRAGGVRTGVYTAQAEVARPVRGQERTDTLTRHFEVALDSSYVFEGARPDPEELGGEAATFELRNNDAVYVRRAPGYEERKRVVITGEVRFPGPYSVHTRQEQLTDLVERAGGLTQEAYAEGLQIWRAEDDTAAMADSIRQLRMTRADSLRRARELLLPGQRDTAGAAAARGLEARDTAEATAARQDSILLELFRLHQQIEELRREQARDMGVVLGDGPLFPVDSAQQVTERTRVGIDFPVALENPRSSSNLLVQAGDSIHVPRYTPTVDVRGAVGVESKVLWREGEDLGYYISQAGGYLQEADEDRVWIRFANGEVSTRGGGFLFFGGGIPEPDPGSTVNVPYAPPEPPGRGLSTGQLIGILTSISTALIVAISR